MIYDSRKTFWLSGLLFDAMSVVLLVFLYWHDSPLLFSLFKCIIRFILNASCASFKKFSDKRSLKAGYDRGGVLTFVLAKSDTKTLGAREY